MRNLVWLYSIALLITQLSGCASGPDIRVEKNPGVDMKSYKTFDFIKPLGTDRAQYSTMITSWLKQAVRTELERIGYTYQEEDPDLLVNFYLNIKEKQEILPSAPMGTGYYGYRYGMYQMWGGYPDDISTITYNVGTLNIDLVDAKRTKLVWQGLAEGRVKESSMRNPGPAIDRVVGEIFANFPNPPVE